MEQLTARDLVLVGLVTQAVLALLFALVWRSLRSAWPRWLALGFAANAASYGAMLAGMYSAELFVRPHPLVALFGLIAVVLISIGVVDYVGVERRRARRLGWLAAGVALVSVPFGLTGVITRASGYVVMSLYVLGWVILFVRAMRQEPHSGHGFVVLALLLYPLSVGAVVTRPPSHRAALRAALRPGRRAAGRPRRPVG